MKHDFGRVGSTGSPLLLVVALVTFAALAPLVATPVVADTSNVSISNVTVSPEQPSPGQLVEFETTVRNNEASSQALEITDIYVRKAESSTDLARVEDLGTVASGSTMTVPLTVSFDSEGVKNLRVVAVGRLNDGKLVRVKYPQTVVVSEGGPQMSLDVGETNADGETTVTVDVTNGEQAAYRNLELVVNGSTIDVDGSRRLDPELASGANRTFTYTAEFPNETSSTVEAYLQYETQEGQIRSQHTNQTVDPDDVEPPEKGRPQLETSVQTALPDATRPVNVTVENALDSDIKQVNVTVSSASVAFGASERVTARLAAGTNRTFRYPATVEEVGTHPVTVTLSYTDDGERKRLVRTFRPNFDAPANPGEITLTDVNAVERGSELEVSATAGNVGSSTVEGVVVSINDSESVGAADYFVGSVEGSDFASFTVTTTASGNVSSVPVDVTYVVGGVERSYTRDVPVEQVDTTTPATRTPELGLLAFAPIAVIGVVLLVIVGLVVRRLR